MKLGSSIVNALNNISSKYHYDCGDHGCKGCRLVEVPRRELCG